MCMICAELQPWLEDCAYDFLTEALDTSAGVGAALPVYTMDQIADQLTSGYWGGGESRFDAVAGDTLTVDLSGLTEAGQNMARQALEAWSDVSGLIFSETDASQGAATGTVTESADAASGIYTAYSMSVGQDFEGSLHGGDRDAVAVTLVAGQTVTIALTGDDRDGSPLSDPYLRLRDAAGNLLLESDDYDGLDSFISFEAPASGTYYIQAGSFGDTLSGDYRIELRPGLSSADITFDDENSGAYAQFWTSGGYITRSSININAGWSGGSDRTDGYFFQTYLHEIGHALGLGHAGNYNGSATYGVDNHYLNDSWQSSVMSYFYQTANTFIDASFAYVITPQIADIIAIQNLYGVPSDTRAGDDVYGPSGTTGTYLDDALNLSNPVSFTVFDSGGTDVFDFSDYGADQVLDLREEHMSDLAGLTGNIGIARGTVIEYGRTGSGDDVLIGNAAGNGLTAGAGNDSVAAGAGNDAIAGGNGADVIAGDEGRDLIEGGLDDDALDGGDGGDLMFGDEVTLGMLTDLFPGWTPPTNAQALLDAGDLLALWDDILADVFLIA